MSRIKQTLLQLQLNRCLRRYQRKVDRLSNAYQCWIKEIEKKPGNYSLSMVSVEEFAAMLQKSVSLPSEVWFAVCLSEGEQVMPSAHWRAVFAADSDVGLVYGDEDICCEGRRYGAWFKPDDSQDTLFSYFYYGSLLFLNTALLKKALESYDASADLPNCTDRQCIYDLILYYTEWLAEHERKVVHIPEILFHAKGAEYHPENARKPEVINENAYWGFEPEYDNCKMAAAKRRGYQITFREEKRKDRVYHIPVYELPPQKPQVSIIIPSKDNVEILKNCISSIRDKTAYANYEILVIDNGSNKENRAKIQLLQKELQFRYYYEPMEFNFSTMCNLGVSKAVGEYLLLLNDDMEVLQPDWLDVMVGQAALKGVGAVGVKLLYPNSDLIQHVGITNLWVGPAHKLIQEHDDIDYYYGRNILPYDMIGVTAACLMVSREKYREAGGFCEDIAVSYNDVDFCFSLIDLGYRNVIRNDVVLYHHESLSRGDDALSDAKWDRLLHEKDIVYKRHPGLKGKDPYYNPNLAGFKHKYFCSYLYPYEQRSLFNRIKAFRNSIPAEWHNDCLTVTLEHTRLERKLDLKDERDVYWLEGWAYVLNMDNSRYQRSLLLIDKKNKIFEVEVYDRYRQDVIDILPEQIHVGLSGFSCRIRKEDIEPGEYRVALLYKDCCSRQKLYRECAKTLLVENAVGLPCKSVLH